MDIKSQVLAYKNQMIQDLACLVSFNSINEGPVDGYPFGLANKEVLEMALSLFEKNGLKTKNLDYYCGFGETGQGEQLIGILAHLDVVPAGEGWNTDPFALTIKDGKMYGRGTTDDKGAVIASLYALKILQDNNIPLNKRIRLIVGCNEETGSKCLKHYVKQEGHIDLGFTPDGNFPGIYGEKGGMKGIFASRNTKIIDIQGGEAINAVCNKVEVKLPLHSFDEALLKEFFDTHKIEYSISKSDVITLIVKGVAAHASMPHLGVNAISYLFKGLEYAKFEDDFVTYYNMVIGIHTDGTLSGVKCEDQYGALTFNVGVIKMVDGVIEGTIDIRYPVTANPQELLDKLNATMTNEYGYIKSSSFGKSLFFDPNSPMVTALVSAYRSVTNDYTSEPEVIGGGTYSKGINNCIAFGCEFPGDNCHIHDANEFLEIDKFLLQTEIYVQAILNLLAI